MRRRPLSLPALFLFTIQVVFSGLPGYAQAREVTVAPGVKFRQERVKGDAGPLVINILTVNLKEPGIHVETGIAQDITIADDVTKGRETVAPIAKRHKAVAAVNGDFFPFTGDPLNIAIRNGEFLSEPMSHRVAMGITADGQVLFDTLLCAGSLQTPTETMRVDGINRLPGKDEITLLTPAYAARRRTPITMITAEVSGIDRPIHVNAEQPGRVERVSDGEEDKPIAKGTAILVGAGTGGAWLNAHLKPTDNIRLKFLLSPNVLPDKLNKTLFRQREDDLTAKGSSETWSNVENAVGGGPWLVKDGKQYVDGLAQGMNQKSFTMTRHPRTAAGVTNDGNLLLVAIDGRNTMSKGTTLPETADIMLRLGAVYAINLDGGGSTTMVVNNLYVNCPSDGSPRPIADALLVLQTMASTSPAKTEKKLSTFNLLAGEESQLTEVWKQMGLGKSLPEWWGTTNGTGFVDQEGYFVGTHAGAVSVVGVGSVVGTLSILISHAAADHITATVKLVEQPDSYALDITVVDKYKNVIPNVMVTVRAKGASPAMSVISTNAKGKGTLTLSWPLGVKENIVLTAPDLPVLEVKRPTP
ncbi:MAG: phosphodiester glycosidase family protein [Chthonomonadales bacterium]